jgi:hypothetical protein
MSRITRFFTTVPGAIVGGLVVFSAGASVGAAATHALEPVAAMGPAPIVRIASLGTTARPLFGDAIVSVRGRVAEMFGNRIVLDDGSGRTLIDLGPGDDAPTLAVGQTITVQGHYGDAILHPDFLVAANGQVVALERHHGGRHGPGGEHRGPHGPDGDRHGDRDDDRAPPPPPPAPSAAAPAQPGA